jgi:hypothetical protein
MNDDASPDEGGNSHLVRWFMLIALAVIAAAVGRQMAIGSADRDFEARLAELDTNRD